ncbi:MAG TPA: hypothetical protein VNW92_11665 [Polyangiaceae bacterium]|jgi:hypothetical protein|nr:hypothetical protein [Polyangiaceae bacterium]
MRKQSWLVRFCAVAWCLPPCVLCTACGSDSSAGAGAEVLAEAPHCLSGSDSLKIEGTIDSGTIDDTRTGSNVNAGYQNIGMPKFFTPIGPLSSLEPNQLALTVTWATGLFDGQTGAITGGSLTLPANHPNAGAEFCVTAGTVGFAQGGSEDGGLKFAVTQVKAGADCSGAASAVDLRGCDNH